MQKLFDRTFWRFILVGGINTIVGTGVMFFCYNFIHLNYWLSSALNYIIGSIVSYFLNKYFTFRNRQRNWRIVIRFTINICICYLIAYGVAKPLVARILSTKSLAVKENGAMIFGMCLFVGLNYLGQRFFAFREEGDKP